MDDSLTKLPAYKYSLKMTEGSSSILSNFKDDEKKTIGNIQLISNEKRYSPDIENNYQEEEDKENDNNKSSKFKNKIHNFFESFKRQQTENDNYEENLKGNSSIDGKKKRKDELSKVMQPRHILMISLGTGIGTGLLVGNGLVLSKSGPAGLVIGYGIASIMIYCVVQAAGELGVVYSKVTGNYTTYPTFLIDPAVGFAVSILYTIQWLSVLPLQLVTAAMTIQFWTTIDPDIFVAILLILVIVINLFGPRGYAESEFFCNICKVLLIIGFIILGIIINCGAVGDKEYIGAKYWIDPGAFANGFKGVCTVFCYAAFSYGGIEVLVLTANEQENPKKAIPAACVQVIFRILFLYMLTTIIVCFLVPYNSEYLLGSNDGNKSQASPFVIAVASHGVDVVPHIINAGILISIISVANSSLYSSPRLLLSLCQQGYLPDFLNYIDRKGRPILCFIVSIIFGLIAFVASTDAREEVFTWLLAISGLSQLFIWMSIVISHLRFRHGIKVQGVNLKDIEYLSLTGYWGSIVAVVISVFILVIQFWVAIAPVEKNGKLDCQAFFENYLAAPLFLVAYLGYKVYNRDWRLYIPASEIQLNLSPPNEIEEGEELDTIQQDTETEEEVNKTEIEYQGGNNILKDEYELPQIKRWDP